MTLDDERRPAPLGRVLGWVWIAAGAVGVVVGLASGIGAIGVFGLFAAVGGGAMVAFTRLREKSGVRATRTLAGNPPPPAAPPMSTPLRSAPDGPPGDTGTRGRSTPPRAPSDGSSFASWSEAAASAEPESAAESGSDGAARGTAPSGGPRSRPPQARVSISEVEDGTGEPIDPRDRL